MVPANPLGIATSCTASHSRGSRTGASRRWGTRPGAQRPRPPVPAFVRGSSVEGGRRCQDSIRVRARRGHAEIRAGQERSRRRAREVGGTEPPPPRSPTPRRSRDRRWTRSPGPRMLRPLPPLLTTPQVDDHRTILNSFEVSPLSPRGRESGRGHDSCQDGHHGAMPRLGRVSAAHSRGAHRHVKFLITTAPLWR